jgi:hypothetical protein
MKFLTICLLVLYFILPSCNVVKVVSNIHQPKVENITSITNWVNKKKIFADEIVAISPGNFYKLFFQFQLSKNFPFVFKGNGTFVSYGYSNGVTCYRSFPEILKNLKPLSNISSFPSNYILNEYKNDSGVIVSDTTFLYLKKLFESFTDLTGKRQVNYVQDSSVDYIVLIPFALYMGSTFQTHDIRKNTNAIKDNTKARIRIILVNFDKQEWWGSEWIDKIKLEI